MARSRSCIGLALVVGVFVAWSGVAAAHGDGHGASSGAECQDDSECPNGFRCRKAARGAPTVVCDTDTGRCPDVGASSDREKHCVPEPPPECESAGDCRDGRNCVLRTYRRCEGRPATPGTCVAGPDGGACPDVGPAPDVSCTTETRGRCLPDWATPCTDDSQCGSGFGCQRPTICSASGGGAGAPERVGDAGPFDAGGSCQTADRGRCEPSRSCSSDSECSGTFTCRAPRTGAGTDGACAEPPGGDDAGESVCEGGGGADPEKHCLPSTYERWAGYAGPGGGSGGPNGSTGGADAGSKTAGESHLGTEVDRSSGGSSDDDSTGARGSGASEGSGGCATTGGPAAPLAPWLALGGFAFAGRRRRRRDDG